MCARACVCLLTLVRVLLQANEPSHVQRLLADATGLRVIPLLQLFLAEEQAAPNALGDGARAD